MNDNDEDDLDPELEESQIMLTGACQRLDEIVRDNTLLAFCDGTLEVKLDLSLITEEDWHLFAMTGLVSPESVMFGDVERLFAELMLMISGIVQFFHYCETEITNTWAHDIHDLACSDDLERLPSDDYVGVIAQTARSKGLSDEDIFCLIEWVSVGEQRTMH